MAEELGTRGVLEQVDARLGNMERDIRDLRTEVKSGFERVDAKFDSQTRWLVGVMFASWLTMIASIWLKQ